MNAPGRWCNPLNRGWFKAYRKIEEWRWYFDIQTLYLWLHILNHARHEPGFYDGIPLSAGQLLIGRNQIVEKYKKIGMTDQKYRTCMRRLVDGQQITTKATNKGTIVTVINWGLYQGTTEKSTTDATTKLTSQQPTNNQPATTNKNVRMKDDVVGTISPTLLEAIQGANRAWEQPAKSILTSFQSLAEEYGEAALIEAIKTAVEYDTQGGVSVAYVKAILKGSGQEPPAEAPTPFDPQKAYGTRDDDIDIRRS